MVESHKNEKTGVMKPTPTDPEELVKWRKEELDAEIDKLDKVMERLTQQNSETPA